MTTVTEGTIKQITPELVLDTLREIVQGNEDFVYPQDDRGQCQYVRDGEPSCIAGQVLAKIGVPVDVLAAFDRSGEAGGYAVDAQEVMLRLGQAGFPVPRSTVLGILRAAQTAQDGGYTWGAALDLAKGWAARWGVGL